MADRRYPSYPIPGVGAVVVGPKGILMATRDKDPGKGMWSIPGGGVEIGESQEAAIIREIKEETGIDAKVLRFIDTADVIFKDESGEIEYHFILNHYLCSALSYDIIPESSDTKVRWFMPDSIPVEESHPTIIGLIQKVMADIKSLIAKFNV
jgi:ADP-ribose pyrophosphatase YjhB (NUDIX family)